MKLRLVGIFTGLIWGVISEPGSSAIKLGNAKLVIKSLGYVNLHVAFLATYSTRKLQKINLNRKSSFFKIALKRVLTPPKVRSRREHSKSSGIVEIGLTYVELRPCYCSIRILVPMSILLFKLREIGGNLKRLLLVI